MAQTRWTGLAWISVPFLAYLFVLHRLWFNAPVWDDYDAILDSVMHLADASSAKEWLSILVAQHNEHRIAVMRFVAWAMAAISGRIDFRVLVLVGNFSVLGIVLLAWAEFRGVVAAPLFAAAGFLAFQWSYYEASLMGSAALPNIGVVFFSLACLYFATRSEWPGAVACVLFGILAVGSQANGLLALPIAAVASALAGKRARAGTFAAVALMLWALYFWSYHRPPNHPSPMEALSAPLSAAQLFLIVIGGIVPGRWLPMPLGAAILVAIAWLARRGAWRAHPTAALWIAFLLLSAAAATVGRVGFGVFHASRYGIYSTGLVVLVFLAACTTLRDWNAPRLAIAVLGAAAASVAVSWASWPSVREYSIGGHLLARAMPSAPGVSVERYFGMLHPDPARSERILVAAGKRGLYFPREQAIYPSSLRTIPAVPATARLAGFVDDVTVSGSRLTAVGWTDILATAPGRTLSFFPSEEIPSAMNGATTARPGVAMLLGDPRLVFSGFRLEADYPSEEQARKAAASLCIVAEAPGHPATVLGRTHVNCPPIAKRGAGA